MEQVKQLELGILITIRNNETIPTDEFHKLFDNNWHSYSVRFKHLTAEGLFIVSTIENSPGLYRYELTKKGKIRIMELLSERSNEIHIKLAQLKRKKVFDTVPRWNIFLEIIGLVTLIFNRFKKNLPVPRK